MRIHADPDPDPQPCFPSVQPPSCIASLLSSLHPVLFPFCPASILYYFPSVSVQPPSCTISLLSSLHPVLLPFCPASILYYFPSIQPPSSTNSILSSLHRLLLPSIMPPYCIHIASLLSCLLFVLPLSWPDSLLFSLPPVLPPSCHAPLLSLMPLLPSIQHLSRLLSCILLSTFVTIMHSS